MGRLFSRSNHRRFTNKVDGGRSAFVRIAVIEARLEQTEFEILVRTEFLSLFDQLNANNAAVVGGVAQGADRVGVVSDFDEICVFGTARAGGKKQGWGKGGGQIETTIEHELPPHKSTTSFDSNETRPLQSP